MTETGLTTSAVAPSVGAAMAVYDQLQVVKSVLAPELTDQELQLFAMVCQSGHWDPFQKEIYAVKRKGRVTFQTGIDGYRSKAEQTGEYDHSDEPILQPSDWETRKPNPHPDSATVTIYRIRDGRLVAQSATARWDSYYVGDDQGWQWRKMPDVMLAKCAEALAFRKLFPRTFEGVYVDAEMDQATASEAADARAIAIASKPTAAARVAARRAAAEAPKAEAATDDGRPVDADGVIEGEAVDASSDWTEPPVIPTMEEIVEAGDTAGIDTKALAKRVLPQWVADNTPHATRKPNDAERVVLMAAIKRGEH